MDQEVLKRQIAGSIAACRKKAGLTQAELAQKINYSDKAVSKWERAESLPDVLTLVLLAEVLGVRADCLVYEPELPEQSQAPAEEEPAQDIQQEAEGKPDRPILSRKRKIIAALVSTLVWFVALLSYQVLSDSGIPLSWIGFVMAVPANAIVLLSLLSAWRYYRLNQFMISVIMWGSLISIFVGFWVLGKICLPKLFLLGVPGQLAIVLWFQMLRKEEQK